MHLIQHTPLEQPHSAQKKTFKATCVEEDIRKLGLMYYKLMDILSYKITAYMLENQQTLNA